jgi:hypothetical protein
MAMATILKGKAEILCDDRKSGRVIDMLKRL